MVIHRNDDKYEFTSRQRYSHHCRAASHGTNSAKLANSNTCEGQTALFPTRSFSKMAHYLNNECADMVYCYRLAEGNGNAASQMYHEKYLNRLNPSPKVIWFMFSHLGPRNGFLPFSQKIQFFWKKLLNNKIFSTSL